MTRRAPRVLVTADGPTARKISQGLEAAGFEPIELSCIRIEPVSEPRELRESARKLASMDWLVVTSRNGVEALVRAMLDEGLHPSELSVAVAAVGTATATAASEVGLEVRLIPPQATSLHLASALEQQNLEGRRVLLIQGDLAGPELAERLSASGARVTRVIAYRTIEEVSDPERLAQLMREGGFAAVTLTSGSGARALESALGRDMFLRQNLICIGPATAQVVAQIGSVRVRVASPHTAEGLVEAVVSELSGLSAKTSTPRDSHSRSRGSLGSS